jgi:hypothetical protein
MSFLINNWGTIAGALLGISECLGLLAALFPSMAKFGGILASIVTGLKGAGAQPPKIS